MTVKHTIWHTHLVKDPKPDGPISILVQGFVCDECPKEHREALRKFPANPVADLKISSKRQAELALEMLRKGPATVEQLQAINPKYPSDPVYYARKIIGHDKILTVKENGKTVYKLIL